MLSESDIQKLALLGLEEKFFITANRAGYDEKEESVLLGLFCFIEALIESCDLWAVNEPTSTPAVSYIGWQMEYVEHPHECCFALSGVKRLLCSLSIFSPLYLNEICQKYIY